MLMVWVHPSWKPMASYKTSRAINCNPHSTASSCLLHVSFHTYSSHNAAAQTNLTPPPRQHSATAVRQHDGPTQYLGDSKTMPFKLASAFPLIPAKLVEKARALKFVDMKELLPDNIALLKNIECLQFPNQLLPARGTRPKL